MATPSRLSYADLARRAQNIRSPNDVQRATTSNASSTSTVSTSFSKTNSNSTTPSSSIILGTRPPSPSLDTTDAKVPAVNVWNVRKEQMAASRTTTLKPSIPNFVEDDDPFVVRMPQQPIPDDGDSWPEVGKSVSNHSSSTTNGEEESQSGTSESTRHISNFGEPRPMTKNEKPKWIPIPAEELQAAADAALRATSHSKSHPRSRHPSHSNSVRNTPSGSQSRTQSRVQSQASSPRPPRGRRLPDEELASTSRSSPQVQTQNLPSPYSFSPQPVVSAPYYTYHSPSHQQHLPLPSPYSMYPPPPPQPYLYWNGYHTSGSGHHTPEYVGYAYPPPQPFPSQVLQPPPQTEIEPQPHQAPNGTPSTDHPPNSTAATKPPRPEDSEAVAGPALGREGSEPSRKVVFGSVGMPGSSQAPSPAPPSTDSAVAHGLERAFSGFSIGVKKRSNDEDVIDLTEKRWEFGTTGSIVKENQVTREESVEEVGENGNRNEHYPPHPTLSVLEIPQFGIPPIMNGPVYDQGPAPNGVEAPVDTYQSHHRHTQSSIMSPVEIDAANHTDEDWAVKDFGFGFGRASGSGYAVRTTREERLRREYEREREMDRIRAREREREMENENGVVNGAISGNGASDGWNENGDVRERSPYAPRGKRGGFFGSHNNGFDRGIL
ncbi:uncharacterized protein EV420DRAFT_915458 [Desarmillaria tabescens]|uniref:Uncharacterized protein n=1 Tax=Armillaria tabescens TaxID=1929756 RepID=A0AA39JQQ5_ARMTA|nr:uncharacterized protein EV420DRAFT_915458 [Desarmillaria tabescens]KAK0446066.1 hypothetical protein EV420DRAFT_915458 [Desarmillaria tabescens]